MALFNMAYDNFGHPQNRHFGIKNICFKHLWKSFVPKRHLFILNLVHKHQIVDY